MQNEPFLLRPILTGELEEELRLGRLINLYGEERNGLSYTISDLEKIRPDNVIWVPINMRTCAESFGGFMQQLANGLSLPTNAPLSFREMVNRWLDNNNAAATPQKLYLCLENFDRLHDTHTDKEGYDIDFLNYLNGLRNTDNVGILITSAKKMNMTDIYIGGVALSGSRLDIGVYKPLPVLTAENIEHFLLQKVSPEVSNYLGKKQTERTIITGFVVQQKEPLRFAGYLRESLPQLSKSATTKELQKQLKSCQQQYEKGETRGSGNWLLQVRRYFRLVLANARLALDNVGLMRLISKTWIKILIALLGIVCLYLKFGNYLQTLLH